MEHHYNESDRFSNVRTSVIVRKSPDESRNRFGRSQQWNPPQQYAGGGSHSQQHTHGNILSPPIDNFTQRFPIILNNQRSSYYQQTSHYTRRNEDRLRDSNLERQTKRQTYIPQLREKMERPGDEEKKTPKNA